jgi:hypothetical protein
VNEISVNEDNLIDSLQRVNIEDGEPWTVCVKNFPQQVNRFSLLFSMKNEFF